ncbi:hypothetical protein BU23DRAFT_597459 [Bimuria novae-zelandiae CBS 107.79]|uniref:Uncharacterized protein n=1 Tax=Bimuria novae-zelandiae CBS 107.79 TaxID=1447943 RepID=A0A6A5VKZ2_9PLEO|nr:hypothetical protein BU23DRAFT_597459 [Bimuria novae-zelandiae CBS 107.79]
MGGFQIQSIVEATNKMQTTPTPSSPPVVSWGLLHSFPTEIVEKILLHTIDGLQDLFHRNRGTETEQDDEFLETYREDFSNVRLVCKLFLDLSWNALDDFVPRETCSMDKEAQVHLQQFGRTVSEDWIMNGFPWIGASSDSNVSPHYYADLARIIELLARCLRGFKNLKTVVYKDNPMADWPARQYDFTLWPCELRGDQIGLNILLNALADSGSTSYTMLDICAENLFHSFVSPIPHRLASRTMANLEILRLRDMPGSAAEPGPVIPISRTLFPKLRELHVNGDIKPEDEVPFPPESHMTNLDVLSVRSYQDSHATDVEEFIQRYGQGVTNLMIDDYRNDWASLLRCVEQIHPNILTVYYNHFEQTFHKSARSVSGEIPLFAIDVDPQSLLRVADTVVLSSVTEHFREAVAERWGRKLNFGWKEDIRETLL